MSSSIQSLSPHLIQRMAAGEVMESWLAVVRELVENALDAQAKRIQIQLDFASGQLQITDNGRGMSREDLAVCCLPHRTSKLSPQSELNQIESLGFRGEALHSLVQVAEVTIASRLNPQEPGWACQYNPMGEMIEATPLAMAAGTTVRVKHLFQAWPQRQSPPPWPQLHRLISQMAICHPQVTWQVQTPSRSVLQISGSAQVADILLQVVPQLRPEDIQTWQSPELEVVAGLPDRVQRRQPDWVLLAINSRCVTLKGEAGEQLQHTLLQAWQHTLPRHRFPLCFAHFHIPPSQLDWQCHPGKQEVYLSHPQAWAECLATALRELPHRPTPPPQFWTPGQRHQQLAQHHLQESGAKYPERSQPLTPLKVLAQVHQMYILVEQPTGLWLVEQHIAHERVLYEQLLANWQFVDLAQPVTLAHLNPSQLEQLDRIGLHPEPFGPQLWLIRQAPALLSQRPDLSEALWELSVLPDVSAALVATACRSAIRNGTPLGLEQMQTLIEQWQATQHPRTCPHGRPICLQLEESSLARFFRRHWVIGKSHGI